jgi:hypothetical protein
MSVSKLALLGRACIATTISMAGDLPAATLSPCAVSADCVISRVDLVGPMSQHRFSLTPELQAETLCVRSSCAATTCSSRRRIDPLYRQPISQLLGLVFRCQGVRRRGCRCQCPPRTLTAPSLLPYTPKRYYTPPLKASSPSVFLQEHVSGVQLQRVANMAATGQLRLFFSALMSRQLPVFRCHGHGPVVLHAGDSHFAPLCVVAQRPFSFSWLSACSLALRCAPSCRRYGMSCVSSSSDDTKTGRTGRLCCALGNKHCLHWSFVLRREERC